MYCASDRMRLMLNISCSHTHFSMETAKKMLFFVKEREQQQDRQPCDTRHSIELIGKTKKKRKDIEVERA